LAHRVLVWIVFPHFPIVEDGVRNAQGFGQLLVVEAAFALQDIGDLRQIFAGHPAVLQLVHGDPSDVSLKSRNHRLSAFFFLIQSRKNT
jgi:hypothetical protein